ncbi:FAD:protein FMN transferase [Chondromyces apiculatus]|uniref:FAD:protein FMN transferase n=1 Tax=Chondromyces apiculatus TaxID=51 RepID=UPI0018CBF411|nr:FAD:protein FMN transferase [Chondromyces apiculatus]
MFAFDALGTRWEIETDEPIDQALQARILARVDRFDATYSRFRPDSLVSRIAMASQGGRFEFPTDSVALFELYDRLHAITRVAMDPLVGRDLELLGYDRTYSLTPAPESAWVEARSRGRCWSVDVVREGAWVSTQRPLVIDVGAAGKGYLVDLVADILREDGFLSFVVDGSGDLRHAGAENLRVGLEHPLDPLRRHRRSELARSGALCVRHQPPRVGRRAPPHPGCPYRRPRSRCGGDVGGR